MLGLGLRNQSPAQLYRDTAPWTLAGLVIMLTTGPAIYSSDPRMYNLNSSFRFKIGALLVAIVYHYWPHRKAALASTTAGTAKLVGGLSLALWVSVVAGGLFIAFV
jgi:hypothetical protein